MRLINKCIILLIWFVPFQLAFSKNIEGVFEGAEQLHVYKDEVENNKFILAKPYSIELNGGGIMNLFSLNDRLVQMGIAINANELVLYDAQNCAVYYRGSETNFREIQQLIAKNSVATNVYMLDLKVSFSDDERKTIPLYKGVCIPTQEITTQGLTIDVACSFDQSNLNIFGHLTLPSGTKTVKSSILIGINTEKVVVVKDIESNCTYEVTLKSMGLLEEGSFFPEDPKIIFSKEPLRQPAR